MALEFGPKLGFVVHAEESENWYDELTRLLRGMDALIQCTAISHSLSSAPSTPADGDVYLLPAGATGTWDTHDGKIARWSEKISSWEYFVPNTGWLAWSNALSGYMKFVEGEGWLDFAAVVTPPGGEPDPLPQFQAAYLDAFLTTDDRWAEVLANENGGSSAVGFYTPYTGQCYLEYEIITLPEGSNSMALGIIDAAHKPALENGDAWGGYWFPGGMYRAFHISANGVYYKNGGDSQVGIAFAQGDRVGVAIDFPEQKAWLMVNGVAVDGGDPVASTGGKDISDIELPLPFAGFAVTAADLAVRLVALEIHQANRPSGYSAWIPLT